MLTVEDKYTLSTLLCSYYKIIHFFIPESLALSFIIFNTF